MNKILIKLFILLLCKLLTTAQGPSEDCLRCLCHARTGCFRMGNCASYSISKSYWQLAGKPTILDDDPEDDSAYRNCMRNDQCIMSTIRGYIELQGIKDCNCDGDIDCRDYLAIHLHGDKCRTSTAIESVRLQRLQNCYRMKRMTESTNWDFQCQVPEAQ